MVGEDRDGEDGDGEDGENDEDGEDEDGNGEEGDVQIPKNFWKVPGDGDIGSLPLDTPVHALPSLCCSSPALGGNCCISRGVRGALGAPPPSGLGVPTFPQPQARSGD